MSARDHVLVVEDEPKLAALLRDYLVASEYEVTIKGEGNGVAEWVRAHSPSLVLLDLMLPGKDGLTVCRELRAFSNIPVIMLTARVEEIDRLLGLELGADDYVCKPYSPREVVARVKAQLRRARMSAADRCADGRIHMDEERFLATLDGKTLDLTPVEFRLLRALVERPGRVLSRAHLIDGLYLDHRVVSDRTVDSHIKNLRRKIADVCGGLDPIRSIYGVGYKIEWPEEVG